MPIIKEVAELESKGNKYLAPKDVKAELENRLAVVEQMDNQLLQLSRRLNNCRRSLQQEKERLKTLPPEETAELNDTVQETTAEVYYSGRRVLTGLCHLMTDHKGRADPGNSEDTKPAACGEGCTELPPEERVVVRVEAGGIYIHTPMLSALYGRPEQRQDRAVTETRVKAFCAEISRRLAEEAGCDGKAFEAYGERSYHFLTVYDKIRLNNLSLDKDAYERGLIRESIAAFLPEGGEGNSSYCNAIKTDLVPKGIYITVTPGEGAIKPALKIIRYWTEEMKKLPTE